jgi:hypothetical protein
VVGVLKTGDVVLLRLKGGVHRTAAVCAVGDIRGVTYALVALPEGDGWRYCQVRLEHFIPVTLPVFDQEWSSPGPPSRACAAELPPAEVLAGHGWPENSKLWLEELSCPA